MKRFALPLLALLLAGGAVALWRRPPASPPAPPPPAPPAPRPAAYDPAVKRWHSAFRNRDPRAVTDAQSEILAREGELRAELERLVAEDPDARIRAGTTTLLSRFKSPPPESFFLARLADPEEPPRESGLAALERLGTRASAEAIDRAAAAESNPRLRELASRAARAARSR